MKFITASFSKALNPPHPPRPSPHRMSVCQRNPSILSSNLWPPERRCELVKPFCPPPVRPKSLLLVARWIGHTNATSGGKRRDLKHLYKLAVYPDEPVAVGRHVRILAIAPITYSTPDVPTNEFDTYDPHVTGVITDVWSLEDGTSCAKVTNACRCNGVREVELRFPRACGEEEWLERIAEGMDESTNVSDPNALKAGLGIMACIRPMPVWRECLGEICWNFKRDLYF